jgi:hypothetical protein
MKTNTEYRNGWRISHDTYARSTRDERAILEHVLSTFHPENETLDELMGRIQSLVSSQFRVVKFRQSQYMSIPETRTYRMSVQHIPSKRWVVTVSEPIDLRKGNLSAGDGKTQSPQLAVHK